MGILDWVMAEFVRLHHNVNADEAQRLIDELVTRGAPVVQDFDGFLKVLKPDLSASPRCLVLLYHRGNAGATYYELERWVRPAMRANLRRTLNRLVDHEAFVHDDGNRFYITRRGQQEVESQGWLRPS